MTRNEYLNSIRFYYAMNDRELTPEEKKRNNGKDKIIFPINIKDAVKYNSDGFGIFKSINIFSKRRKKEAEHTLVSWAIDIDDISKEEQETLIKKVNIEPSQIIETKRGFHIYWNMKNKGTPEEYYEVVKARLIPIFSADKKCADYTRILRAENYYHVKDVVNPFMVKSIYESESRYTYSDMIKKLDKHIDVRPKKQYRPVFQTTNKVTAEQIFNSLGGFARGGGQYQVHCPNTLKHKNGDRNPSLSITQKADKVLVHCQSSCSQEEVISTLKEKNLW